MRKIIFIGVLFILCLFSCNQDEKEPEFSINGYWTLNQIIPLSHTAIYSQEIDFDEKYIFNHDGTFIKFSNKPKGQGQKLEVPQQALGVYHIRSNQEPNEDWVYEVSLIFDTNLKMAANCSEGNIEFLYINKSYEMINLGSISCDGPSFVYSKSR